MVEQQHRDQARAVSEIRCLLVSDRISRPRPESGHTVAGPVGTVEAALRLLERERPDVAALDVNLGSQKVTPVAERLRSLNIPFVLSSAYTIFDCEGDEVLTTNQDYPRMINTFRQRERREGIRLRQISLPVPAEDDEEVVRRFEEAITPRTELILMCHMINITGQILPVKEVTAMAREHDVPVIVDGAHALAHFEFDISELEVDNYSTSLHKWLFAPIGNGLLYVREEKIPEVWPLMAAPPDRQDDIRKFEEIGTHPEANFLAVGEALTFHQLIGGKRKEQRLIYLRDYWAKELRRHERVRLHTSLKPGYACGIANVEIRGVDPGDLFSWLWNEHQIRTTPIVHDEFRGIRVSPSVYTTPEELDRFVDAMTTVADGGLPTA
jgi:selenocysteine lyase/cysteine desulfurase